MNKPTIKTTSTTWIIVFAIVAAFVLGWRTIGVFSISNTITVNGECLTSAPKDRTAITLRISVTDKSAAKSMNDASAKAKEINDYLKTLDVRVQTSEFNSYEKSEWNNAIHKSEFVGIETTIALDVSASNIDIIEEVLTKFAGDKDVYISNLRMFTSAETMKPILESCLGDAVKNARDRADALAAGDGKHAGKILAMSYGTGGANVAYPTANFRLAKAEMAMDTGAGYVGGAITGKDTDVSVTVSATFEIR